MPRMVLLATATATLWSVPARLDVHADGWHEPPFVASPYEYWDQNRDELGFPRKTGEARPVKRDLPAIENVEKAKADYAALLKRYGEEQNEAKKQEILEVLRALAAALQNYELSAGGQRPLDARKKAFVHTLISAAAYTNPLNLTLTEFGWVLQNRDRFMREIVQILKEIGPEAVPQIWEHLRTEIVFFDKGRQGKAQARQDITRIDKEIRDIRAKQAAARSKEMWDSLEAHIQKLQHDRKRYVAAANGQPVDGPGGQGAPLTGARSATSLLMKKDLDQLYGPGMVPYDKLGLVVGEDYIDILVNALVAIGPEGLKHWKQGLWDPNPQVRSKAIEVLKAVGLGAVPQLVDELTEQKDAVKQTHVARALEALTDQKFGTDVRQWEAWWKKNKPLVVPPGRGPGQVPLPPGVAPPAQPPADQGGAGPQFPGPRVKLPADEKEPEKTPAAAQDDPFDDGEAVIKPRE